VYWSGGEQFKRARYSSATDTMRGAMFTSILQRDTMMLESHSIVDGNPEM